MDTKKALRDDEKPEILSKWREANPNIVALWKRLEEAAKRCIGTRRPVTFKITDKAEIVFNYKYGAMTVKLPSGRELFYPRRVYPKER